MCTQHIYPRTQALSILFLQEGIWTSGLSRMCNSNRSPWSGQIYWAVLKNRTPGHMLSNNDLCLCAVCSYVTIINIKVLQATTLALGYSYPYLILSEGISWGNHFASASPGTIVSRAVVCVKLNQLIPSHWYLRHWWWWHNHYFILILCIWDDNGFTLSRQFSCPAFP